MLSHRNIVANALNTAPALGGDEETVYLHAAPMFHAADNAVNFVVTARRRQAPVHAALRARRVPRSASRRTR